MLRIGLMTETLYKYLGIKRALKKIKDLGFECADITLQVEGCAKRMISCFNGKDYKKKAKDIKEYADKIHLPLVQAHAPFPSIKDNDNRFNKMMFKKLIKSIEICGILKVKYLVIHPLHDYDIKENIAFYNKLLPYAKKANVVICCENMYRTNKETGYTRVCTSSYSDTFNAIIDGVNSKYLKACIDIGHAYMFKHLNYSPTKLLEEMKDRVVCLHIHDNDSIKDKHWIPFRGSLDYKEVCKSLKKINYKGDLIIEISTKIENVNTYKKGIEYWKEAYNAMRKIQSMIKD